MHIENLTIELTRRCNLACSHCMRGKAQNCDIKKEYIDAILEKFDSIGSLCLGGGEPSLVPELIQYVTKQIKKRKIALRSFDVTTNAVKVSNAFMRAMMELYLCCDDKENCSLSMSNDGYHADSAEKNLESNYQKLEVFRFVNRRRRENGEYYHDSLLDEGNGRLYGGVRALRVQTIEIDEDNDIQGQLYVNCLGNVVADCDMSYESQDCDALQVFNVMKKVDVLKKVKAYNKRVKTLINKAGTDIVESVIDYYECYINVEESEGKAA